MDRQCRGRPIARLDCSVLQMRYRVAPTAGCALPFVHMLTRAEGLQKRPSLAGIPLPRMLSLSRSRSSPCPGERQVLHAECSLPFRDRRVALLPCCLMTEHRLPCSMYVAVYSDCPMPLSASVTQKLALPDW